MLPIKAESISNSKLLSGFIDEIERRHGVRGYLYAKECDWYCLC